MYDRTDDECLLIGALARDVGVDVTVPDDPGDRWRLLRSLMNVRGPAEVPPEVLEAQDRVLGDRIAEAGVTDADDLRYEDGIALWRGDITTLRCDAIVNAANSRMLGCFVPCHRCIDNAIHTYAGMQMRLECDRIMGGREEPTGGARATGGYNLPCRYVLHTVGPIVDGRLTDRHRSQLRSCYTSCLGLAASMGLRTLAFCCVSTGEFRFPNEEAAAIAVDTVRGFLDGRDGMRVIFDVFTDRDEAIYRELLGLRRRDPGRVDP